MAKTFLTLALSAAAAYLSLTLPTQALPETGWAEVKPGLEYREVRRGPFSTDSIFELRCDPARTRLGLIAARDYRQHLTRVPELARLGHCWAAVNGGYFGPEGNPLGYQRDQRRVVCPDVATGGAFGGLLVLGSSGPDLVARDRFLPGSYPFALQCGPRLIVNTREVQGIHPEAPRRRTGIGYDRQGRVFLYATGISARFTLAETQKWLAGPREQGGLDPRGVLNLDGGSSTQFFLRTPQLTRDVPGLTGVAVAVGVFPK